MASNEPVDPGTDDVARPRDAGVTAPPVPLSEFTQPALALRTPGRCTTCSGHGRCIVTTPIEFPFLEAVCDCDPGYLAVGTSCVACRAVDAGGQHDISIRVARVHGTITLGGKALPEGLAGEVALVPEHMPGAPISLGRDRFDLAVIGGRYDVVYREGPADQTTTLVTLVRGVDIGGTKRLNVELGFSAVGGRVRLDGSDAPATANGTLELRRGDDHIALPIVAGSYAGYAPRGKYDLVFAPAPNGGPAGKTVVRRGVTLARRHDVTLRVVAANGRLRGLGGTLAHTGVRLVFWDRDADRGEYPPWTGARQPAADGSFSAPLVTGRYDVMLTMQFGDRPIAVRIARDLEITSDAPLDLSAPRLVRLHGRFLADSKPPAMSIVRHGPLVVALGESETWGYIKLELDQSGRFSGLVPVGRYMLSFAREAQLGVTDVVAIERVTVEQDLEWNYNLPLVDVRAQATVDGRPAPPDLHLTLVSPASPVTWPLVPAPGGSRVAPGTYDVRIASGYPPPAGLLANSYARVGSTVRVDAPTTLPIAITTRTLSGRMVTEPATAAPGSIHLSHPIWMDVVRLGAVARGSYDVRLAPRSYGIYYTAQRVEPGGVMNKRAFLGCIRAGDGR